MRKSTSGGEGEADRLGRSIITPVTARTRPYRLGRALRAWRGELCAYLDCPSSGGGLTEGTNLKIGNARRGARG